MSGKTGPRVAYSIESLPLLMQWLDQHPNRGNREAWLWTDDAEPLTYDRARFKLLECRRKANINKRIFFHLLRHSSATQNAALGEPMLRSIYGWSKNSDEPSTYIHLSGETIKKALLEKAGLNQNPKKEPTVLSCPRCGSPNQPNASLCVKCKSALKIQDIVEREKLQKDVEALTHSVSSLRRQFYRATHDLPVMTDEELDREMREEEEVTGVLREKGYTVKIEKDGVFVKSKPNR